MKWLNNLYKTYVFDPLAGGNGKIQMDEMTKAVLVVMICRASWKEGISPEQVYPDIYWICIFASVCAIAAIKPAFSKFKSINNDTH
jgi:hypothetical protein